MIPYRYQAESTPLNDEIDYNISKGDMCLKNGQAGDKFHYTLTNEKPV